MRLYGGLSLAGGWREQAAAGPKRQDVQVASLGKQVSPRLSPAAGPPGGLHPGKPSPQAAAAPTPTGNALKPPSGPSGTSSGGAAAAGQAPDHQCVPCPSVSQPRDSLYRMSCRVWSGPFTNGSLA